MTHYSPKNILVTGGAGFIGSHFIHTMLAHHPHISIVNLDLLTYAGSKDNLTHLPDPERHHLIVGNICDEGLVTDLLLHYRIDTLVHFAAESHVDRSISGPKAFIETNIVGTYTLLEAARNVWLEQQGYNAKQCRFHHISTDEVFGSLTETAAPFAETHPYQPNSPYSASKASSDHLVRAYLKTYGLPITLSNCSNNYGPHQHNEKLIPTIINACLNQQPIPLYGKGDNIRDWLYVEDHCLAIDKILTDGTVGETYNVGGNNEWRNVDLVHEICRLMDERLPAYKPYTHLIQQVADRPGHDYRYGIDSHKIEQELQWKPQESMTSGLLRTIQFIVEKASKSKIYSLQSP